MRICIPTEDDEGLRAQVAGHLGRAPFLTLVDTESGVLTVVPNEPHQDGQCRPHAALAGQAVQAVVCAGVGRRALLTLESAGIRVLATRAGSVDEVLESLHAGTLRAMSPDACCAGHDQVEAGCHGRR
jgi:predicted Fe-Mo cluster-binding NifX family protein